HRDKIRYSVLTNIPFYSTTPSETFTLSLHDALPIYPWSKTRRAASTNICSLRRASTVATRHVPATTHAATVVSFKFDRNVSPKQDRKSTRLNSSHVKISYAVFCLKKKIVQIELQRPI